MYRSSLSAYLPNANIPGQRLSVNVLVFEAGGYEFTDYWCLGLPLEILVTAVAVPILLWLWPL